LAKHGTARETASVRYLLLDRITVLETERATAIKCVSLADDVFVDHFPGHPVMPGSLIIESLAQLGGVLVEAAMRAKGHDHLHALLTMIQRAKFRRMVRPGDRMELETKLVTVSEDGGQIRGTAIVDGALIAEAELGFAFAKVTSEKLIARRREILEVWLHGTTPADPAEREGA
jgi:3-hydroxymyristoyl/3-hydroxydecanoyl-(acyl carrier protein) dehydratase